MKKKREFPLNYRKLLSPKEFKAYKENKRLVDSRVARQRLANLKRQSAYESRTDAYNKTRTGKVGGAISRTLGTIGQKKGVTRFLYRHSISPVGGGTLQGSGRFPSPYRTGKTGRPVGTYDNRYAKYGGVYGWRKYQAQQNQIARAEYLRSRAVTPLQQDILRQIEARQMARRTSPERQVIPSTQGDVAMQGIFNEIDSASNAFA